MHATTSAPSRFGDMPAYTGATFDENRVKTTLFRGDNHDGHASSRGPLATFLGLFSIGLGLWETAAPRGVAHRTGVRYPSLLRAYGLREMAAGVGILASDKPGFWLWNRVAGDILDLATIAAAYAKADADDRRKALEAQTAAVAGVTALDVLCACEHARD